VKNKFDNLKSESKKIFTAGQKKIHATKPNHLVRFWGNAGTIEQAKQSIMPD